MEKEIKDNMKKELKAKMKKDLEKQRIEMQNWKVRFPTHTKCVPLYIHSTQCCSHVLRLLTQFHITITYFLDFRSKNFNCFASKLPKSALRQEVSVRLEFSNFQK